MQNHDLGRGCDDFGYRGEIINCIFVHGLGASVVSEMAHTGQSDEFIAVGHGHCCAGEGRFCHALLQYFEGACKTLCLPGMGILQGISVIPGSQCAGPFLSAESLFYTQRFYTEASHRWVERARLQSLRKKLYGCRKT